MRKLIMTDLKREKDRLEQFRAMEREANNPFAVSLVRQIVVELEARLARATRKRGNDRANVHN